jgi:alpha-maltose-1-phosphate synthase
MTVPGAARGALTIAGAAINVAILTREYPPDVYGGAGVHVEYLARELSRLLDVTVHCWGDDRPGAVAHRPWDALADASLQAISFDLEVAEAVTGATLVHSHTWYANLGGHLAKLLHGIPHVATVHSLEPMRPWKAEQLGGGYAVSTYCEQTALEHADAIIAVSKGHAEDIFTAYPAIERSRVTVIYNGIDTAEYKPDPGTDVLERHGVDPARPSVVFVGRITRQKGLAQLLDAALEFDAGAQLVLCAGAPDTPEIAAEIEAKVERVRAERGNVIWLQQMLPKQEVIQLLSHATVFVCPSIYEPLGIVNLEAMACEAAVVASAVGGIPEVVEDGVTGLLVPLDDQFAETFAARVNELLADPERARRMGEAGRARAVERFSWSAVAAETVALYESLL